jgi:hypothetical protein
MRRFLAATFGLLVWVSVAGAAERLNVLLVVADAADTDALRTARRELYAQFPPGTAPADR